MKILAHPSYHSPEPSPERSMDSGAGNNRLTDPVKVYDIAERSTEVNDGLMYRYI